MANKIVPACEVCQAAIKPRPGKANKFCSIGCYRIAQRSGTVRVGRDAKHVYACVNCGVETKRQPSRRRNGVRSERVFCGRPCYDQFRKNRIAERSFNCATCGVCVPGERKHGSNAGKYCSMKCRVADKRVKAKHCVNCGSFFTPVIFHLGKRLTGSSSAKTCSTQCMHEWRSKNPERREKISLAFTGENHPNWMGGTSRRGYRGPGWQRLRRKARKRAGYKCEHCGIPEEEHKRLQGCELHVNHKHPFHQFGGATQHANRLSNLEALCRACHTKADWKWRKANPMQHTMAAMFELSA